MVLKSLFALMTGAALLTGAAALADEYRPDDFLQLDLSKALLSPTPLGPETHFAPVRAEAKADHAAMAQPDSEADVPRAVATRRIHVVKSPEKAPDKSHEVSRAKSHEVSQARSRVASADPAMTLRPRGAARTKLAHRRSNPLDAQAMDTRIQTWPCKPGNGAICNWR